MKDWVLANLPVGETAVVESVGLGGAIGLRMMELGVMPGTAVTCLHRAPSGSPGAYRVRGAAIAIRRRDAGKIRVLPWK